MAPPATDDSVPVTRVSTGTEVNLPSERPNENSAVYKIEGEQSVLFMGDVQDKSDHYAESWLIQLHDKGEIDLSADILVPGHHASKYGTSEEFLARVDPAVAIISSGPTNTHTSTNEYDGHPHDVTLKRLHERDIEVYWTAGHGTLFTDIDDARRPAPTTALTTTNAADLAALKYYCREHEATPTEIETLAPGHLPEATPEWVTDAAPLLADTSQAIVDAAITNAETVAEVRQTLDATPDAHEHLQEIVQTDRDAHVPSEAEIKANQQAYENATEAHTTTPSLLQRVRMRWPTRFGGIDPPTQGIPSPEEIEGPRSLDAIPDAAREDPAAYYRAIGLTPTDTQQAAEAQADTAVVATETAGELCWDLRQTDGAHKEFLSAIDTQTVLTGDETPTHATTAQQEPTHDLPHDTDSGVGIQ